MEDRKRKESGALGSIHQVLPGLFVGGLLIICGFFGGWYWEQANIREEIQVSVVQGTQDSDSSETPLKAESSEEETTNQIIEQCIFVGSKNSDKFHLSNSGTAKRIKNENKVCFASEEDALAKGYSEGDIN